MKQISFLLGLTILSMASYSQQTPAAKRMTLKVTVSDSIHRVDQGYLATIGDSGIVMMKTPILFDQMLVNTKAGSIPYQNISEVTIKRKGSVGRGILFGALGGALVGGIAGLASYRKPNCEGAIICFDFGPGASTAAGAVLGTVGGGIIGGVIGAVVKKRFVIGGRKAKFDEMKNNIFQMTYRGSRQ